MAAENVELRGLCPRETVDTIDAVCIARDLTRTDLVNQILGKWAAKARHEASLILRCTAGNPSVSDSDGRERK
jgi:hypothetical protein